MAKDHYISQTYLKHFCDEKGLLHAYRKSDGAEFPCRPKAVCHEWDGDLNPAFLPGVPNLLGEWRGTFESRWNTAMEALRSRTVDPGGKFAIAGLFANLMVCTPTWRRIGVRMMGWHATRHLSFAKRMQEKHGYDPEFPIEAIEMLERGEIKLETEPEYVKAMVTMQLSKYAWAAYHSDWTVLRNETAQPFLTSDNPVAIVDPGGPTLAVTRFLPGEEDSFYQIATIRVGKRAKAE